MSKTPRTLIQNYLDASKTQSVRKNQHGSLVRTPPEVNSDRRSFKPRISRTPEPYTRSPSISNEQHDGIQKYVSKTPEPYMHSAAKSQPQHDRVSTLRSKRRSVSKNDVQETPRGLIQAFLESEDTTVPLVRYASRTSQGRLSSTQPLASAESARSSLSRPGNWTIDLDSDTPRTLLQRYILNSTDVIDTPAPRGGIPQPHTPDVLVQQDVYRTPSPFKTNSTGFEDVVPSPRSARGKTPRSARRRKEQFSVLKDNVDETRDESMIPPTNPDDYKVPSPFRSSSSDEESFIPETQQSRHVYDRSQHHRGHFDISMSETMKEEILQYQQSQREIKEKRNETRTDDSPYKDEIASDSENEMDYDDKQGTRLLPLQTQPGTSMLPDWEEYTMPLKGEEMDKSPVISDKGYHNMSLQEGYESEQIKRYGDKDRKKMGRWSEGHQSRFQSPRENTKRSAEGQRRSMPGQMTVDTYFSPQQNVSRDEASLSRRNHSKMEISSADGFESRSAIESRKMSQRSPEMMDRMSSRQIDNIMDVLSPARIRSYNEDVDILYSAQKLENREKSHHHTLPNISGNFSPRITSTQRNVTMETPVEDDDNLLPAVTPSPVVSPSPSPRHVTPASSVRSSTSRILMPSTKDNQSMSVSPASSARSISSRTSSRLSDLRSRTPQQPLTPVTSGSRNLTPGSSARQSRSQDLTPLQTVTPSPVVSSGANSMNESRANSMNESQSSLELQPSSRKSTTALEDSKQGSQRRDSRRLERSRTSENRSRLSVQTPNKSLAASPVVAGRRLARDMVNTLPNNTVNFSPQIASTQNMATISCVGQSSAVQESKKIADAAEDDNEFDDDENRETGDDEQWQDEMDAGETVNKQQSQQATCTSSVVTDSVPKCKVVRKPRQKSNYSLPVSVVKKQFTHFAGMRVSKEAIEEVMKVSEKYWDILAGDLEAYAKHAGRKKINMSDFVLLFKRQGYVTEKQSLKSLIEKYLPMEEREKLIPVARAGNRIEPPL